MNPKGWQLSCVLFAIDGTGAMHVKKAPSEPNFDQWSVAENHER